MIRKAIKIIEAKSWTITISNFPNEWEADIEALNLSVLDRGKSDYETDGEHSFSPSGTNTFIYDVRDKKDYVEIVKFAKEMSEPDDDLDHNISYTIKK